jgi:4-hydroxy-tetrahydrodipicolinate reductase
MKLAVVGARGRLGRLISLEAKNRGFDVIDIFRESLEVGHKCHVVIDASLPEGLSKSVAIARDSRAALLVLSTGHKNLEVLPNDLPVCVAPNASFGVFLLSKLCKVLGRFGGEIELIETHHTAKKDKPSGTALMLKEALGRDVNITSLRGGTVPGEHEIRFYGEFEEVRLIHRAEKRELFAVGALKLALILAKKPPGLYSTEDLFSSLLA